MVATDPMSTQRTYLFEYGETKSAGVRFCGRRVDREGP